jgi:RNA polymerase sigma factor (sigma-70 family)
VELVARAVDGDRNAWAEIWDEHGPRLHAYARRLLSSPYDVDDVVADTFVSAAEHLAELRDPAALRPWLYAICRRHVQRRWESRDRVRPVDEDTLVRAVDSQEQVMSASGLDAAEAQSLLWAAADGLGQDDRDLLALLLSSDLDSGDVARITGDKPNAVYVRVSRLKDSLGRAAGALLVARHHREDCAELDALLRDWDGGYSTVWRKRIARHVDGCDVCGSSRTAAASSLFAVAGAAPLLLLPELKRRVLDRVGQPELEPVSFDQGWPVAEPWERERRRLAVPALAMLVVAAVVVLGVVLRTDDTAGTATPAATTLPTTAVVTTGPTSAGTPRSASPRAATPTPPLAEPTPTSSPSASLPSATPSPRALPPLPTVRLRLTDNAIQTSCGSPSTTVATATVTGAGTQTVISWDGTAPGGKAFAGSGSATIGPFQSVTSPSNEDTVTVRATDKDALGRKATTTRILEVQLAPC